MSNCNETDDRAAPRVVVRPETDDGAARARGTRDLDATCAWRASIRTARHAPNERGAVSRRFASATEPTNSLPTIQASPPSNQQMTSTLVQDLRYGMRQLRSNPGFTTVAVLSLALGVGANSAIFQLVNAVRLRTLPVANPQELVTIDFAKGSSRSGGWSTRSARMTSAVWEKVHALSEPFTGVIAWSATRFNLAQGGEARYAEGMYVSGDFFRVLGVRPIIGRTTTSDDDRPGCGTPGAVVSYAFWQRELAADAGALGRDLRLDGQRFPLIGVTPPEFFGVEVGNRFDIAVPLCSDLRKRADSRTQWWLSAMGRLKPGWTEQRTQNYIKTVSPVIMEAACRHRIVRTKPSGTWRTSSWWKPRGPASRNCAANTKARFRCCWLLPAWYC